MNQAVTDGGRNPAYGGCFPDETPEMHLIRLAQARRIAALEGLLRRSQIAVRVLHTMLDVSLTHSVGIEVAKELDADIEAALGGK